MKDHHILNAQLLKQRADIEDIIRELYEMTVAIGNNDLSRTVSDISAQIHEPFMFVIVGEVKVGKSSFTNALLQTKEEVAKVAPDPCTDTIQQILYGEENKTVEINPHLKKIFHPVEILKEISVVDTPGTNTIQDYHQEITERFVPSSDLIVFVFEAKNPYRQSAWDFFDYIHTDWRKKIIFVLQQADLMEPDDLKVNQDGVIKLARQKGIEQPLVFSVSAKWELDGKLEESGFLPLREYIKTNVTGGKAPLLKLINNIDTASKIGEIIKSGLNTRTAQLNADLEFREDIKKTLTTQENRSGKQVDILVENLLAAFDRITTKTENELATELSFLTIARRSFLSIFSKSQSLEETLTELSGKLEKGLNEVMREKLNDGVHDIAERIQGMAKMIDMKIRTSRTILKDNHEIFGDIADRRANVLKDLQDQFVKFINRGDNFIDPELIPDSSSLSPNLATGSGLAVIGLVVATVTQGMVFDITGGIITTLGLVFAGVTVGLKRRKILAGYREEIANGRNRLATELEQKLKAYISKIRSKIDENFDEFDNMLEAESHQVESLEKEHLRISQRLNDLRKSIEV